jgi:hypothetical protein
MLHKFLVGGEKGEGEKFDGEGTDVLLRWSDVLGREGTEGGGGPVRLSCHAEGKGAWPRPAGGTDPGAVATSGRSLAAVEAGEEGKGPTCGVGHCAGWFKPTRI